MATVTVDGVIEIPDPETPAEMAQTIRARCWGLSPDAAAAEIRQVFSERREAEAAYRDLAASPHTQRRG